MAKSDAAEREIAGQSSLPLVPSETKLNLGQVPPGSQKSCTFWLTNRTAAPVEVAEVTTSCDCLTVKLPERRLMPGQKVQGSIQLDLRHDPGYTGNLGIEVSGKGTTGKTVFAMTVAVVVQGD